MEKMALLPDSDGYSDTEGEEVLRVALDGGAGRYRTDKIGASKMVNVKWTMTRTQYQYWRAFFVTGTGKGALPFLCDLVSEDGMGPAEHVCQFVPGSVTKPMQIGLTYVQQATLEVAPLPHDADLDAGLILLYGTFGEGTEGFLSGLAHLVNVVMPDTLY
jgi:hypothetical protein